MKARRVAFGALGLVLVLVFVLLGSDVAALVPVDAAVDLLGNDYLLIAAFAAAAFVLAAGLLLSGRPGNVRETTTPDPERAVELPVPGDDFDAAMASRFALLPFVGSTDRGALRERLRMAAVNWVVRAENCPRSEAERLVDDGAWTGDPDAALFLAADASARRRVPAVLGSWVRFRPYVQVGALRTARALVESSEDVTQAADAVGHETTDGDDRDGGRRPKAPHDGDSGAGGGSGGQRVSGRGGDQSSGGRGGDQPSGGRGGDQPSGGRGGGQRTGGRDNSRPGRDGGGGRRAGGRDGERQNGGRRGGGGGGEGRRGARRYGGGDDGRRHDGDGDSRRYGGSDDSRRHGGGDDSRRHDGDGDSRSGGRSGDGVSGS